MVIDYITQLRNACANNHIDLITDLLQSEVNKVSLDDMLTLIPQALNHHYHQQAIVLFKSALAISNNLNQELTQWLLMPILNQQDETKHTLISEAVNVQTDVSALLELGLLYRDHGALESAEQVFLQIIQHNAKEIRAFHRLISVYIRLQRNHEAIACCQLALEIDTNSLTAHYNLGVAYLALNQHSEAFAAFARTLEIDANNQWAHINIAHIMLKLGHFAKGWQQYEARKLFYEQKHNDLARVYPEWAGQSLNGKHLLVWEDQGLGDTIMYAGFVSRLLALGANVSIMAQQRLKLLFGRSFALTHFYPELITTQQQTSDTIDYQISFSGLGARFIHDFSDFNNTGTYLVADQHRSQQIRESLQQRCGVKKLVGFSWRGGVPATKNFARCIALEHWQPLCKRNDCLFVNLQYDSTAQECSIIEEMGGINLELDHRNDIDSVAAVLRALDVFVSMDNSTAHLAGALGVPVYNLLPFSAEWRWFLNNEKCYWYQSMTLFRQSVVGQWHEAMVAVDDMLSSVALMNDVAG